MAELTEIQSAIASAKAPIMLEQNGMPILLSPPGWGHTKLEKLLPAPLRIMESPVFNHPESFASYYNTFAGDGTRIFADDETKTIVSVFDGSDPGAPGHGDHTCALGMAEAPEWSVWKNASGHPLNRNMFTRFIENNLDYITETGGMSGAQILSMCRDLRVKGSGDLNVKEDYTDGKRSLDLKINHQVGGNGGSGDIIPFPEELTVSLRVFKNSDRFDFKARLRWDIKDHELYFIIDLADSSIIEDDAFSEVVAEVGKRCEQEPLLGKYRAG